MTAGATGSDAPEEEHFSWTRPPEPRPRPRFSLRHCLFACLVVALLAVGSGGSVITARVGTSGTNASGETAAGPGSSDPTASAIDHGGAPMGPAHDHSTHDHGSGSAAALGDEHANESVSTREGPSRARGLIPVGTSATASADPGAAPTAPGRGEGGIGHASALPVPANDRARGLVYDDLVRSPACPGGFEIEGDAGACTHGPDPVASGVSVDAAAPAELSVGSASPAAVCDGDGTTGKRIQVIYAYANGVTPRAASYAVNFRQWANDADALYSSSAAETGGTRNLRFVHDGSCNVDVQYVQLSATGADSFTNTTTELRALGFDRTDRKYMLFVDANIYCGIGSFPQSAASGPTNPANVGPHFGRTDVGCWGGAVAAHETMHNLGGVNDNAPNSSRGGHCIDEWDRMCYSDGGESGSEYVPMKIACSDSSRDSTRFDCNHDDYYSTNPVAGGFLATHWNTANNEFLIGSPSPPAPPSNDPFASPIVLSGGSGSVLGTTAGATKQSGEPSGHHIYNDGASAWWTFTPSTTGGVTIDLTGSAWETVLGVYTGSSVSALTQIASDHTYPFGGDPSTSVTFTGTAGTTYRIAIAGIAFTGAAGPRAGIVRINWTSAGAGSSAPTAPYGLVGQSTDSSTIGISWIDASWNETEFQIQRSVNNGAFAALTTVAAGITSYTDTTVVAGSQYAYRVRAVGAGGSSAYTNVVYIYPGTSPPGSPPAAPSGLGAAGVSVSQINLTWTDNSSVEWGFKVERALAAGGPFTEVAIVGANSTTFSNTGLASGQTYFYRVRATNPRGDSAYTSVVPGTTNTPTAPGAPTSPSASAGDTQATVAWVAPLSNGGSPITGYTVTSSPGNRTCSTSGALTCVVTGLNNSTPYTFTVTATNSVGTGPPSAASNSVTPTGPTVPGPPTGPAATAGNGQATVSWSAPASNGGSPITGYTVTSSPGNRTCSTSGALTCVVTGLTNGTAHTFTVRATNVIGTGAASVASNSVTPIGAPGAPTGASAAAGNAQATVSWSAPASSGGLPITSYMVTSSPGARTCSTTGTLSCTVTGLDNGTAYTFTVRATNSAGAGAASAASNSVTPIGPPGAPTGAVAVPGNAQATVSWSAPASNGGTAITSYTVTSSPGNRTCAWSSGPLSCVVTGLLEDTAYTFTVRATNAAGTGPASSPSSSVTTAPPGTWYHPLTPARIADSRASSSVGAHSTPWGAGTERDVTVAGVGGVPAGATAVALNVTVTGTTAASFLSVWPSGLARPNPLVSSLNWTSGMTIPNAVTAKVGANGRIRIFNASGSVDVIIDVVGWYGTAAGDGYNPTGPGRILDSRSSSQVGAYSTPWGPQTQRDVTVAGVGGVPANADAVVLNVTVTGATASSFLSVWPSGQAMPSPLVSSLNWTSGMTVPNAVTARVGAGGQIRVFNPTGDVHVIIDVVGYFTPNTGRMFYASNPARVQDSRSSSQVGAYNTAWGSGVSRAVTVAGTGGIPADAAAVLTNTTVTNTTAASFLSVWLGGAAPPVPLVSSLNWLAGWTIPNSVTATPGSGANAGRITVFNSGGNVDVIIDTVGYYR